MFCPHCGSAVKEEYAYCPACGKPLSRSAAPAAYTAQNGIEVISEINNENAVFQFTCTRCATVFRYKKEHLGYRAWYPSGFVYCPSCHSPCRHHPIDNLVK